MNQSRIYFILDKMYRGKVGTLTLYQNGKTVDGTSYYYGINIYKIYTYTVYMTSQVYFKTCNPFNEYPFVRI